ncbi:hypothetical protein KEJ50_06675 [Candidatus Bathyarchaeota archaeon]|nr:hypothetical protein [Candidatus Bathyarchaeota archaeon]
MKKIKCSDCNKEMKEYYVGLIPIGMFLTLGRIATYICENCGRITFYLKDLLEKT